MAQRLLINVEWIASSPTGLVTHALPAATVRGSTAVKDLWDALRPAGAPEHTSRHWFLRREGLLNNPLLTLDAYGVRSGATIYVLLTCPSLR